MFNSTRTLVSAILLGLLLVVSGSALATYWGTKDHNTDHHALSILRYQRELTHQLTLRVLAQPESVRLDNEIETFQQNMRTLRGGDTSLVADGDLIYPLVDNDPAVQTKLDAVSSSWRSFRGIVNQLRTLPVSDPAREPALMALEVSSTQLLDELEDAARLYEDHMAHDLSTLRVWQTVLLLSAITLLVTGLVTIRQRIVRPAELLSTFSQVGASEGMLNLPDELYADEVTALVRSFDLMRPQMEEAQEALEDRVLQRTRLLMNAFEFSQEIVGQLELNTLLRTATTKAKSLLGAHSAAICLVESDGTYLELVAAQGEVAATVGLREPMQLGQPILVVGPLKNENNNGPCSDCAFHLACGSDSCLAAPLQVGDELIGSLCVVRDEDQPFDVDDRRALTLLASAAAVAITNTRLSEASRHQLQETTVLAERQRLAAELHDNLAQTLGYLRLRTDRAKELITASADEDALLEIEDIRLATQAAYDQVRGMLDQLHDSGLGENQIGEEIYPFIDAYQRTTGISVAVTLDEEAITALSGLAQLQAVHIIREALTNVQRHAQATHVTIQAILAEDRTLVSIEDNGTGFDPGQVDSQKHLGLAIMRARTRRCGGRLTIRSKSGQGTIVTAYFPLKESVKKLSEN
jgi:two-component system nitrate/nitrite sensor histidine kinase NarX